MIDRALGEKNPYGELAGKKEKTRIETGDGDEEGEGKKRRRAWRIQKK